MTSKRESYILNAMGGEGAGIDRGCRVPFYCSDNPGFFLSFKARVTRHVSPPPQVYPTTWGRGDGSSSAWRELGELLGCPTCSGRAHYRVSSPHARHVWEILRGNSWVENS